MQAANIASRVCTAMKYALRRTWPDDPSRPDDFVYRYKGHDVGRIYLQVRHPIGPRWTWTIYLGHHIRQILPAVSVAGTADTLAHAIIQFKSSFDRMIAKGAVNIP